VVAAVRDPPGRIANVIDSRGPALLQPNGANVGWVAAIVGVALVLPTIAVLFRRLHDTGRSGWWWLLSLICCIGVILLWIFCLSDSKPGTNQYGPNPKGV
jgi:uncharacterized membrane protein YhaH (DUF805 family)